MSFVDGDACVGLVVGGFCVGLSGPGWEAHFGGVFAFDGDETAVAVSDVGYVSLIESTHFWHAVDLLDAQLLLEVICDKPLKRRTSLLSARMRP